MVEWMGIELDPFWLDTLTSPIALILFSFPIMFFIAFAVTELKEPVGRLIRRHEKLGRLLDEAEAKGPREGWSGYVIAAITATFLFATAAWVYFSISK